MNHYHDKARSDDLPIEKQVHTTTLRLVLIVVSIPLGFLIANQLINTFILPYSQNITNKYRVIQNLKQPVDVVILGDSTADRGINPTIIKEQTGMSAVNLSTVGRWAYYADFYTLQWYLEKFGSPELIILSHTYDINRRESPISEIVLDTTTPLDVWESDYIEIPLTQEEIIYDIMATFFPAIYRDISTRAVIDYYLFGIKTEHKVVANGFVPLTGQISKSEIDMNINRHKRIINNRTDEFTDYSKEGRDALIKLINDNRIPTYVTITPILEDVTQLPNFRDFITPQQDFWNNLANQYPHWHYNPEIITVDTSVTTDSRHLNQAGATLYTQYLIDWIWGDYQPPSDYR